MEAICDGIKCEVNDKKILLEIDKTDGTASASGKSIVIASTRGNKLIPGTDLKLGLNIYRSR